MATTRDNREKMEFNVDKYSDGINYMLNVPGTGNRPDFIADPQIRLQKFGANLSTNVVDINSNLLGVDKQLNRDHYVPNTRDTWFNDTYKRFTFPVISSAITDQPRASMPAWNIRDLEKNNWNYLHTDPQQNTEMMFDNNINSRMVEKDIHTAKCRT
jgi:hypothetical protein